MKKKLLGIIYLAVLVLAAASSEATPKKPNVISDTRAYIAPKLLYSQVKIENNSSEGDTTAFGGALAFGYDAAYRNDILLMRLEAEITLRSEAVIDMGKSKGKGKKKGKDTQYKYDNNSFMLNGAIGLNTGTKLTPYLTGGVGFSHIDETVLIKNNRNSTDRYNFTWSVGADLTYRLNHSWQVGLEYRRIDFGKSKVKNLTGAQSHDLTSHEIMLALRYRF